MRTRHILLSALVLGLAAAACGPRVAPVSLHDPRLPVEARRWLADAEDEVAIAGAALEEARTELETAEAFKRYVDRDVNPRWPRSAPATAARDKLGDLVRERLALARLEVRAAEKQGDVARARLRQTRAETAVRHDIRAYDLDPLRQATDAARASLAATTQDVEGQRARVDEVTTAFWVAYGAYARSGGRNDVLWGWED